MKKDLTDKSALSLEQLAQRLIQGDTEAIELIYRRYFHRLVHYGIQVVGAGNQHKVEDVIQEFFIWLAENSNKINEIRNFESYMFQCIRRNVLATLSAERKSQATYERYANRTAPLMESTNRSPEQLHIQQEDQNSVKTLIRQELNQLPPYLREALYLRYFEDKPYPEIASILSVSDQVAYNYVFRAIKRLKNKLGGLKALLLSLAGIIKMFLD